jgi:parallel beta-helix repeat protein
MRSPIVVLSAALPLLVCAAPALAATLAVPRDFPDPQAAVDAASPGDRIVISQDWRGKLVVDGKSDLRIQGRKGATIDADGETHALVVDNSTDIAVSKLRFTGSTDDGVIIKNSADVKLSGCSVSDTGEHGIAVGSAQRITVERSTFENCGFDAVNLDVDLTGTPPTDCRVSRNRIDDVDDDGIDVTGDGHVIEKNRIENTGNDGIIIDDSTGASNVTISKNRTDDTGEKGVTAYGSGHTITKNKITDAGDDGIRLYGDGCTVSKNKISSTDDDGIDVSGDGNTISKNTISRPGGDGFDVDGNGNTYTGNKVTRAGDDGMQVTQNDNVVEKNQFLKCEDHGIVVQEGMRNSFDKNKALKNDDDDIWTDVPVGDNTWGKNKYKTGNIE